MDDFKDTQQDLMHIQTHRRCGSILQTYTGLSHMESQPREKEAEEVDMESHAQPRKTISNSYFLAKGKSVFLNEVSLPILTILQEISYAQEQLTNTK